VNLVDYDVNSDRFSSTDETVEPIHLGCFSQLSGFSELALDILEVGSVPAFGHLAINKSAAGMGVTTIC
jgi:hypothetical protein